MKETQVWSPGREDPLEKGMATPSSVLAWRIPWTEEPGRLQPWGCESDMTDWHFHGRYLGDLQKRKIMRVLKFQAMSIIKGQSWLQHAGAWEQQRSRLLCGLAQGKRRNNSCCLRNMTFGRGKKWEGETLLGLGGRHINFLTRFYRKQWSPYTGGLVIIQMISVI